MAFNDYIDKETRNFLLIFAGLAIFLVFIFPRLEPYLLTLDLSQPATSLFPEVSNVVSIEKPTEIVLDQNKDYKAHIQTSVGDFEIDLFEKSAPKNVSNFLSILSAYPNAVMNIEKDFLIKVDSNSNIRYNVDDEINADYLLLDTIKVKDAPYLRNAYDPNDPTTKAFEPNNLRKYEDFTVKQFYSEILGYKYDTSFATPKAVKYTVYMASTGPNTNKANFFILMAGSVPEIDGRYTPIGRVTEGFTTLDKINNSETSVKLRSIVIQ